MAPVSPAEAARRDGQVCTVAFQVASVSFGKETALILSAADRSLRQPQDLFYARLSDAVVDVLEAQEKKDWGALRGFYKGKTVRVTGKVTVRDKTPEITVSDLKQLLIVGK